MSDQLHPKKVLMIDDDDMMRVLFRDTFWIHSAGDNLIEVITMRNLAEAKEYLESAEAVPDAIFLGLWLLAPTRLGTKVRETLPSLEFIKGLRQNTRYAKTPIVVYSRFGEAEFKDKAKEAGADHYLVKGELTPREMVDFVERL